MSAIASSYGVLQPNSTTLQCNASAIQCQSCLSLWDRSFIPVPHAAIIDYTNNLIWCVEHQVWPMSDGPTDTIFWSANWSLTYQMEGVLFLVAPTFEKVFWACEDWAFVLPIPHSDRALHGAYTLPHRCVHHGLYRQPFFASFHEDLRPFVVDAYLAASSGMLFYLRRQFKMILIFFLRWTLLARRAFDIFDQLLTLVFAYSSYLSHVPRVVIRNVAFVRYKSQHRSLINVRYLAYFALTSYIPVVSVFVIDSLP